MHTLFLNVAGAMARHWASAYFAKPALNKEPYNLAKNVWQSVGSDLAGANNSVPAIFCRTLCDLTAPGVKFKAIEWQEWVLNTSMIVLQGRLPAFFLDHWAKYVCAVQLSLDPSGITPDGLKDIDALMNAFYSDYEKYYYRYEAERLPACRLVFHYLLHLAHCIKLHGPPSGYWSYVMERFVGLLGPLVHSRIHPYSNLANSALLDEQFRHLHYRCKNFDLPSSENDPSDEQTEKLGLLGLGKVVKLSANLLRVLRAGYEKILSVADRKDGRRVRHTFQRLHARM